MVRRRLRWLVLGLWLASCAPMPNQVGASLRGRVTFSQKAPPGRQSAFRVAMAASDVVAGATVSLVAGDQTTIAAGLTDADGAFTLTTGSPPANGTYQLIAAKRVDGKGRLLHLTTTVAFDGSSWRSITASAPDVVINPATTAVEIVASAMNLSREERLEQVAADPESGEYYLLDEDLYQSAGEAQESLLILTEDIMFHVMDLVDVDIDPLRGVCFVEKVVTVDGEKTAGSIGVSRVKVTGFGFDPVPERNSVGFQVGAQTIWTKALPGSTTQVLYARVPDLPRAADGGILQGNVPVHVRNGVGTLEVNAATPATFNLYFPRRLSDAAIKLPDAPEALAARPLSLAVGSLTGYINLAFLDLRFAGNATDYAPVLRIWDTTANSLASLTPRVSAPALPNVAADPAEMPLVKVDESAGPPFTILTHVLWRGINDVTGNPALFHRTAENGVWRQYTGGAPSDSVATVANLTAPAVNVREPSVAQDGPGLFVAYGQETNGGVFNTAVRRWNGSYSNGIPNWSTGATSMMNLTSNASLGKSARMPQAAVGPDGINERYHVAWFSDDGDETGNGAILYRRGRMTSTTAMTWEPPHTGNPQPAAAIVEPGLTGFAALTLAADKTNRLMTVWLDSAGLHSKRFDAGLPPTLMATTGKVTLPPLPGDVAEGSPRLVAVGDDDFYLVTASRMDGPPGLAGEIWLRRCRAGVWSEAVRVYRSPGTPSEHPTLDWNGDVLTVAWLENRTPVAFNIYGGI